MSPESGSPVTPSERPTPLLRAALARMRQVPFTVAVLTSMVLMGIGTKTLWHPASADSALLQSLSFGAPRLHDRHLWTFGAGAMVLPRPEFYPLVGLLLALGLSRYERLVGSLRAAAVFVGAQLGGSLLTALLLWPLTDAGWPWAAQAAGQVDLGLSAGAIGVIGAGTALLSPIAARRVRLVALTYLLVLVLKSGLLWDVEHLIAFLVGLFAGPRLARRPHLSLRLPRITPVSVRSGVALVIATVAVANLVESVYPGMGGIFGAGRATHAPMHNLPIVGLELVVALLVADGLRRGRAAAWWIAGFGTSAVLINTVLNSRGAIRATDALCCVVVLALLVIYRNAWHWRTPRGFAAANLKRAAIALSIFAGSSLALVWTLRHSFTPEPGPLDLMRQAMSRFTFSAGPLRATDGIGRALLNAAAVVWGVVLIWLLVPFLKADRGPDGGSRETLGQLLRRHGGGSIGWMRTWPAFSTWTSPDGQVAVGYCVVGTVAIAIGDPVGPQASFGEATAGFRRFCAYAGWTPCWFAATAALTAAAPEWRSTQIGEDTVMDLTQLNFVGKSWQDVRTAKNRATREGITVIGGRLADLDPALVARIECISTEWVQQKSLPEMGFTLGTLAHAMDPEMRTHVAVDADGAVQGVTTWLPIHRDGEVVGWTLDLMRRRPSQGEHSDGECKSFRPVMEYLIAESALMFKAEGYAEMSLSVAPLARRTAAVGPRTPLDRILDLMSRLLEPTYGFRSLLAFKAKFHPEFRPVYLMYSSPSDLLAISMAIGKAYLPHLDTRQMTGLVRSMRSKPTPVPA